MARTSESVVAEALRNRTRPGSDATRNRAVPVTDVSCIARLSVRWCLSFTTPSTSAAARIAYRETTAVPFQIWLVPPSTGRAAPVVKLLRPDAKNSTVLASRCPWIPNFVSCPDPLTCGDASCLN
jgi:hypothetical protein